MPELHPENLQSLARRVREHMDSIEQDVPEMSFVVGGAVRDALLGEDPEDVDFVVVGESPESMEERGFQPIDASSFPVFHDDEHEEWALARTERKVGHGYSGFETFTDDVTLEEDLRRRDLRMNAMALSSPKVSNVNPNTLTQVDDDMYLVDPHGGVFDLEAGRIRHTSDAFAEDPLRVLRAARYAGRFDFKVDKETMDMMRTVVPELNRMSRDRIGMEFEKALMQAEDPRRFFEVLLDCGALAVLIPELDRGSIIPAGLPEHHGEGDIFEHTMMVVDRMHEICEERDIHGRPRVRRLLMAMAHDLGKVRIADKSGGIYSDDPPTSFGGHDKIGIDIAENVGQRLGLGKANRMVMMEACKYHMDAFNIPTWDSGRLLEFVYKHRMPDEQPDPWHATVDEILDLLQADHEGRIRDGSTPSLDMDPYRERVDDAIHALDSVDGYTMMRDGLCEQHASESIDDESLAGVLHDCDDCRTPGEWIGNGIRDRQIEIIDS